MTTYARNDHGIVAPINSTTISVPKNASTILQPALYMNNQLEKIQLALPDVPTNLLTASYHGGDDYAGTMVDIETVETFSHTNLVITQPTPYDEWMNFGIYTETPNVSVYPASNFSTWPASMCGTYTTVKVYSWSYWTLTSDGTKITSSTSMPTSTITQLRPTGTNGELHFHFGDLRNAGPTYRIKPLGLTYIRAKSTQITEARTAIILPTDIIEWLATQEHVVDEYPYIKDCVIAGPGTGQPVVHVPVVALTVTSSHFLDEDGTRTTELSDASSVMTITRQMIKTLHTTRTIGSPTPGDNAITNTVSTDPALPSGSGLRVEANGQTTTITANTGVNTEQSSESDSEKVMGIIVVTAATSDKNTMSALSAGPGVHMVSSGEISTMPMSEPEKSVTLHLGTPKDVYFFADKTSSAGEIALISLDATYSALSSGSGINIVAGESTSIARIGEATRVSTIAEMSSGYQTSTMLVAASEKSITLRSGTPKDVYVFAGKTLSAGESALISLGATYSALSSGSGIIIVAEKSTSTAKVGDAMTVNIAAEMSSGFVPHQLVTVSGNVYTTSVADGNPLATSHLTGSMPATITNSTASVLKTETSSSTHGIGDAIMSGIGGVATDDTDGTTTSSAKSIVTGASLAAGRRSAYVALSWWITFSSVLTLMQYCNHRLT